MRITSSWIALAQAAVVVVIACSPSPAPVVAPSGGKGTAPLVTIDVPDGSAAPERREIACGERACIAGREACCRYVAHGGKRPSSLCVPLPAMDGAVTSFDEAPLLRDACTAAAPGSEWQQALLCDDSTDCTNGEPCVLHGMAPIARCGVDPGGTPSLELCRAGTCRSPRTSCVDARSRRFAEAENDETKPFGLCMPTATAVSCAGRTCSGRTPVCCIDAHGSSRCTTLADCDGTAAQCTTKRDCGAMSCCVWGGTSACRYACADGLPACESNADCPSQQCTQRAPSGLRYCQ